MILPIATLPLTELLDYKMKAVWKLRYSSLCSQGMSKESEKRCYGYITVFDLK